MFHFRRFWAIAMLTGLLVSGCMTSIPIDQGAGAPQPSTTSTARAIDLSKLMAVDYRRSGGLAGIDDRAQLFRDGRVVLQRRGQPDEVFWLTADELAQLDAAFEAADFHRNALRAPTPPLAVPDSLLYTITRRGLLVESTLNTHETAVPAWAQPLLPLLDGLLLTPQPGRAQPAATTPATDQAAPARLVLVELRRSGGAADDQVLVNLDGSYSVARQGVVTTGQLGVEQLAALLRLLENANLPERAAEYLPDDTCCDRVSYELIYRNLMGGYQLRTMEGAVPDWLQPILDTIITTFLAPGPVAGAPTGAPAVPAATLTPTAASVAAPPSATPTRIAAQTPTPTAAALPSATPSPTVTQGATPMLPTTAPTTAGARPSPELAAFYGELVAQGAVVMPTGSRVTKPYLSAPGTLVRVNGQPVQVFEYADAALLEAEISGLAPDASSIDGRPLAWQGTPHFWRRGPVLVLWVGDDPAMLELLHSILGEQIAGV